MTQLQIHNLSLQSRVTASLTTKHPNKLDRDAALVLMQDTFATFLPFFQNQPEGSLRSKIAIKFSTRMSQKLGLAYLFAGKIHLNWHYFKEKLHLMPYTLFHEMTHMWLYDCYFDPGHTVRFYKKMNDFGRTGLPVDPEVLVHTRVAPEGRYVYSCPRCQNRWFRRDALPHSIFCGQCYDGEGVQYIAELTIRDDSNSIRHQDYELDGVA